MLRAKRPEKKEEEEELNALGQSQERLKRLGRAQGLVRANDQYLLGTSRTLRDTM